jgi:hypothetical protein
MNIERPYVGFRIFQNSRSMGFEKTTARLELRAVFSSWILERIRNEQAWIKYDKLV